MENNYVVKLTHEGLPCWHIVKVSKIKEPLLSKLQDGAEYDVSNLGEILASGWGKEIPEDIREKYDIV